VVRLFRKDFEKSIDRRVIVRSGTVCGGITLWIIYSSRKDTFKSYSKL
jgi:hypothetical protein